jgi:DNA-binding NtrC family response regulator
VPSGIANIVVVDDEPALLESMRSYLSHLGHVVTAFQSAGSAWEYLASDPGACSVVIVDMTVAGMPAREFVHNVVERNPEISVLATSGYPISLEDLGVPEGTRVAVLEKPFTPRMLTDALERLLGAEFGVTG